MQLLFAGILWGPIGALTAHASCDRVDPTAQWWPSGISERQAEARVAHTCARLLENPKAPLRSVRRRPGGRLVVARAAVRAGQPALALESYGDASETLVRTGFDKRQLVVELGAANLPDTEDRWQQTATIALTIVRQELDPLGEPVRRQREIGVYGEGWDFGLEHKDARSMRIDLQRPSDSSTQARVKTILADVFGVRAQAIGLEAWSSSSTTLSSTFLVGPVLDLFREPNQGGWQFYWDYTKVELDLVRTNDLLAQAQHDQYKGSPEAANRFIRDSLDGVRPPTQLWQTTVQIRGSRRHEGFAEIPEMLAEAIRRLFDQTGYQVAEPANDAKGGAVHEREMRWVDAILDAIETGALDP